MWVEKNLKLSVCRRVFNSVSRTKRDRGAGAGLDGDQQQGEPQIPLQALPLVMLDILGPGIQERPKGKVRDRWDGGREQLGSGSGSFMEEGMMPSA